MTVAALPHKCVVVYTDGSTYADTATAEVSVEDGHLSAPAFDPYEVQRAFPRRWQAYIRANFRNPAHVQRAFSVSERTARKWWTGETGANGGSVAVAMQHHPKAAALMLFAAE